MSQTIQGSAGQGLVINVTYDPSVASAPAGFKTAVNAAVQYIESQITNAITVNIDFGWGEIEGSAISYDVGESSSYGKYFTYSQVKSALTTKATSTDDKAAVATLPTSDPTQGGTFYLATAEAEALGLVAANGTGNDGAVGLNSSYAYTFDPNNRSVSGEYDAVGVLEHEITEVLGRDGSLGSAFGTGVYTPLDLFRYTSPGQRDLTPAPGYFSVNGQTLLLPYNDPTNGGDATDWAASVSHDSFGDAGLGEAGLVSTTDLREMDVIGYTLASTARAAANPTVLNQIQFTPNGGDLGIGKTVTVTLLLSNPVTVSGAPTLTLNDGGTATYLSGSASSTLVFTYTVAATDSAVQSLAVSAANLNGGSVTDGSGAAVSLAPGGLGQSGPQVDTTVPVITAIVQTPASGTLTLGGQVTFTLSLSAPVYVSGAPTLSLNDGGSAAFAGGSGSSTLTFNYTVGSRDTSVSALAATAIVLNGATIAEAGGNNAVLAVGGGIGQTGPAVSTAPAQPLIAGTATAQVVNDASIKPFAHVVITDNNTAQNESVTISLSNAANGTFSNLGTGTANANAGTYTVTGTPAAVTAAVNAVVFTPTAGLASGGASVTTAFTISVTDTAGVLATNSSTTVIDRSSNAPVLTTLNLAAGAASPVLQGAGVIGDSVVVVDGAATIASGSVAANGQWSVALSSLSAATHNLSILQSTQPGTPLSSPATLSISVGQGVDTINPGSNAVAITAAAKQVDLVGGTGSVTITGGAGGGTLAGGAAGGNSISGGAGQTTILGSALGADTLVGAAAGGAASIASGAGSDLIVGGTGTSTILTGTGNDTVNAGAGAITVVGQIGSPIVYGGAGTIFYSGGTGAGTVAAGASAATVFAGAGGGQFYGGGGSMLFIGGSGASTAVGGNGNSTLFGGSSGHDVLVAGLGPSTVVGSGSGVTLVAIGKVNDALVAGTGSETLVGSADGGNDLLFAGPGSDAIFGGTGNDTFVAATGNSIMVAGASHPGADVFVFSNGAAGSSNSIFNFVQGRDHAAIYGYGANAVQTALNSATVASGSTTITLSDKTQITFANIAHLTTADFA